MTPYAPGGAPGTDPDPRLPPDQPSQEPDPDTYPDPMPDPAPIPPHDPQQRPPGEVTPPVHGMDRPTDPASQISGLPPVTAIVAPEI
jgi:hypothetical protein